MTFEHVDSTNLTSNMGSKSALKYVELLMWLGGRFELIDIIFNPACHKIVEGTESTQRSHDHFHMFFSQNAEQKSIKKNMLLEIAKHTMFWIIPKHALIVLEDQSIFAWIDSVDWYILYMYCEYEVESICIYLILNTMTCL